MAWSCSASVEIAIFYDRLGKSIKYDKVHHTFNFADL